MSDFKAIRLRPHHALCIQFFRGRGYSEAFTENMRKTVEELKLNPTVKIVCKADVLCAKCPNLSGGDCVNSDESVARLDAKVSELCGFSVGEEISAKDFFTAAREKIIAPGKMKSVCGECSWSDICFK
jgi:hypothetical protein